jgi:hypothetical protein
MTSRWRARLGWPFLIGVLATVVLTILSAVVTSTTATLSMVIALIGLTVTLLLDLITRVEQQRDTSSRAFRIADGIQRLPEAAADFEASVTLAGQVADNGGPRFREALAQASSSFREDVEALSRGDLRVQVGSGPLLSEETALTQREIRATSVATVDEAWWGSEAGREYAAANRAARVRGVAITRIYIFAGKPSQRMREVMEEQRATGARIYAIERDEVPPELLINVVIFDQRAVYQITETGDPRNPLRMLHTQPSDVQAAIRRFEQLLQLYMQLSAPR